MQYPGYNTGKIILSIGGWFPFRVHKLAQLQDEEWYYILEDVNGLKHFIKAEYYNNYGFKVGDEILCKIDRTNCTGRMFLEPKHPCYTEGEIYLFDLVEYPYLNDPQILIVKEITGKTVEVPLNENNESCRNSEKMIRCIVKNIRKGIPILELVY